MPGLLHSISLINAPLKQGSGTPIELVHNIEWRNSEYRSLFLYPEIKFE